MHGGELLCVQSPEGRTMISCVGRNDLGVLDHATGLSDTEFDRDARLVEADRS